ncbi:MAG: efflux RND transporter periplasmic adaptor subunit [Planctomycetota bacterium]
MRSQNSPRAGKELAVEFSRVAAVIIGLFAATSVSAQISDTFTEPYETIEVSAAESGLISQVDVQEGQRVKKGQRLGQLDNRVLMQSRRMAQLRSQSMGKLNVAKTNLALTERRLGNLRPLQAEGHANPNEVADAEAEFQRAQANLEVVQDERAEHAIEVERIESQLELREIRTPIDGVITKLHRKQGEYLTVSDARFATVVRLSQLRAKFFISTSVAERLKTEDAVHVLLGDRGLRVPARIDYISPVTDSQSGTVRIDVLIENGNLKYRSGIRCKLVLPKTAESHVATKSSSPKSLVIGE